MYSYVNAMNICFSLSFLQIFKERLMNKRLRFKPLRSLFFIFIFMSNIFIDHMPRDVYGHFLFGNPNDNSIQIQTNGNYKMGLTSSPAEQALNKTINVLITLTSTVGDKITQLPAYMSLQKAGNTVDSQPTLIMIDGGHFHFKTIFSQPGKYLLTVNVKDLLYSASFVKFTFVLDVNDSPINQFYNKIKSFFANYYYIDIPIFLIVTILFIRSYHQKNTKEEMKI